MPQHLITLQQIRDHHPCKEGWTKLLKSLDNPKDMTLKVSIGDVAKSNGADDALWCCRCINDRRFIVSLVMPSVKRASVRTSDKRVHDCISTIEKWLSGDDTVDLKAADTAACAAARDAARAAWTAYDAACAAARDAANAADAADTAACAARAADAAYDAAWAVRDAACAARAADTAWAAARAARAADTASRAVEKQKQIEDIIALSPLYALK